MAATKDKAKAVAQDVADSWLSQFGSWLKGRPDVWAARRAKRQARRAARRAK